MYDIHIRIILGVVIKLMLDATVGNFYVYMFLYLVNGSFEILVYILVKQAHNFMIVHTDSERSAVVIICGLLLFDSVVLDSAVVEGNICSTTF